MDATTNEPRLRTISAYNAVRSILTNENFAGAEGGTFLSADLLSWKSALSLQAHRGRSDQSVTRSYLRGMLSGISSSQRNDLVSTALDRLPPVGSRLEAVSEFAAPLARSHLCLTLGLEGQASDWLSELSNIFSASRLPTTIDEATEYDERFRAFALTVQRACIAIKRGDLVFRSRDHDVVVSARSPLIPLFGGSRDTGQAVSIVTQAIMAGHETVTSALISLVSRPPDSFGAQNTSAHDHGAEVDNSLREQCPIPVLRRTAITDTHINGERCPAGTVLALSLADANLDSALADRAGQDGRVLPILTFGLGTHRCPGDRAATSLLIEVSTQLRARHLALVPVEPFTFEHGHISMPLDAPVEVTSYTPSAGRAT
ncbi:MAG: hypothetical protein KAZ88_04435 [Acidimicrobiia bacterium]|nr:hypothetical protein [Acidimicrobiia bacterium]MBP8180221.1 hypothetical protein [Acidimicrobiia bacterium]